MGASGPIPRQASMESLRSLNPRVSSPLRDKGLERANRRIHNGNGTKSKGPMT